MRHRRIADLLTAWAGNCVVAFAVLVCFGWAHSAHVARMSSCEIRECRSRIAKSNPGV
jgi:hypothetical protein